jgi:hypothetical protein
MIAELDGLAASLRATHIVIPAQASRKRESMAYRSFSP